MPMPDWIHKYPRVQALLQQDDEVLDYGVEGEATARRGPNLRGMDSGAYPSSVRRTIGALLRRKTPCVHCRAPGSRVRVVFPEGRDYVDAITDLALLRYETRCNTCTALSPP